MTITIQFGLDPETMQLLRDILAETKQQGAQMTTQLQALTDQVKANTDLIESAVTLIGGLAAQIEANKADPVALQALADSMKAEDTKLAGAITANTPGAPPVTPVP